MNRHFKKQNGFSLLEFIIVIFLSVLLTTMSIANFRAGERQKSVAIAADTVINAIRNAQNFALSGRKTNNSNANCRTPQYFYVTFTYPSQVAVYGFNNCSGNDLMETYSLPNNTRITPSTGLSVDSVPASSSLTFYFALPNAALTAKRDSAATATFTQAGITVEYPNASISKTVTVDGVSGRIGE